MQFCTPNAPAGKPYGRDAFQLAPAPLAVQPMKTSEITDVATSGNALDVHDLADDLEARDPKYATVMADTLTLCR
jgi:hypothetical protein